MGDEHSIEDRTRRDTARWGRGFKALLGIPLGPGALLTLRLLMAS